MNYRPLKQFALRFLLAVALAGSTLTSPLQAQDKQQIALIPYPTELKLGSGSFSLSTATSIVAADKLFANEAAQLNTLVAQYLGKPLGSSKTSKSRIRLVLDNQITAPEGYKVEVSANEVVLKAKEPAGMFRAVQTIRQLLPANEGKAGFAKSVNIPAVQIADQPAYEWRGMHL